MRNPSYDLCETLPLDMTYVRQGNQNCCHLTILSSTSDGGLTDSVVSDCYLSESEIPTVVVVVLVLVAVVVVVVVVYGTHDKYE